LEGAVLTTLQNIKAAFGEWQKVEIAEEEQQQHQQPMKGVGKAKKRKGDPSNGRTTTTKRMTTSSTPPLAVPQYPFEVINYLERNLGCVELLEDFSMYWAYLGELTWI
jgi:hypothetical protein